MEQVLNWKQTINYVHTKLQTNIVDVRIKNTIYYSHNDPDKKNRITERAKRVKFFFEKQICNCALKKMEKIPLNSG